MQKECVLCGKLTTGSVGAAGIEWDNICQPCKDGEDAALAAQVASVASCAIDAILKNFEQGIKAGLAKAREAGSPAPTCTHLRGYNFCPKCGHPLLSERKNEHNNP